MTRLLGSFGIAALLAGLCAAPAGAAEEDQVDALLQLLVVSDQQSAPRLALLSREWRDDLAPMVIELLPFVRSSATAGALLNLLGERTGQVHGVDLDAWRRWLWANEPLVHPLYAEFKGALYGLVDPRFGQYFGRDRAGRIRLDEVVWGGVPQDGIPPLRAPEVVPAARAGWLEDGHVVFGVVIGDRARAYPKRILAWHELVLDELAGVPLAGVYCTLCGAMIVYETEASGVLHQLGTSGFLYRSNKLMFDRATGSLWSSLLGEPVIGPLVGRGISLVRRPVVVTTWGAWRSRHPHTSVMALPAAHRRDYSEGAAYREYFATDRLMFAVPGADQRLANKAPVIGIRLPERPDEVVAVSVAFLQAHPVHHLRVAGEALVLLTDPSGASRVYRAGPARIADWDQRAQATGEDGRTYHVSEDALIGPKGERFGRVATHQAFWFAWQAAFPGTGLVR